MNPDNKIQSVNQIQPKQHGVVLIISVAVAVVVIGAGILYFTGVLNPANSTQQNTTTTQNTDATQSSGSDNSNQITTNQTNMDTEKSAIIAAILNKQSIMASMDVSKIKAYELKLNSANPAMQATLNSATDASILSAAKIIVNASVTADDLNASTTDFKIDTNTATVVVTRSGGDHITTIKLTKIDGVWY